MLERRGGFLELSTAKLGSQMKNQQVVIAICELFIHGVHFQPLSFRYLSPHKKREGKLGFIFVF